MDDIPVAAFAPDRREQILSYAAALRNRDEQLNSLKSLAGFLAHDFNNSLVPFLGYITLIKDEIGQETDVYSYLDKMEAAARKTGELLDSVLLAVRPGRKFAPKPIDFSALVQNQVNEWASTLPESAAIELCVSLSPCQRLLDEHQWQRVVRHILNNARYALAAGGRLEIALRKRSIAPDEASALSVSSGEFCELTFKDYGFGMTADVAQRACEPFFTTRAKGQGVGLGLTIAHSVTQLHGGQLTVESAFDAGTTVTIWLPMDSNSSSSGKSEWVSLGSPKALLLPPAVLFVDRDPLLREAVKSYLKRAGIEAATAEDGPEALKLLQRHADSVQIMVIETASSRMSGRELACAARQTSAEVGVVFVQPSASSDTPGDQTLQNSEAVLRKPYPLRELKEAILARVARKS